MSHRAKIISSRSQQKLKNNLARIKPLLDLTGVWTIRDGPGDPEDKRKAVVILKQCGAIERHDRIVINKKIVESDPSQGSDILNQWSWNQAHKEYLKQQDEKRTTFPGCEHRVRVCNSREVDGYTCSKCNDEGKYPEYSREQLESWL